MRRVPPCSLTMAEISKTPTMPRHITISEVEQVADASFTHTPMMAKTKLANSIHRDCIQCYGADLLSI